MFTYLLPQAPCRVRISNDPALSEWAKKGRWPLRCDRLPGHRKGSCTCNITPEKGSGLWRLMHRYPLSEQCGGSSIRGGNVIWTEIRNKREALILEGAMDLVWTVRARFHINTDGTHSTIASDGWFVSAELPVKAWSSQQLPVKAGSSQQLPVKAGSSQQLAMKAGSLQQLPVKAGSSQQLAIKAGSLQQLPLKAGSSQQLPRVKSGSFQQLPPEKAGSFQQLPPVKAWIVSTVASEDCFIVSAELPVKAWIVSAVASEGLFVSAELPVKAWIVSAIASEGLFVSAELPGKARSSQQ